MVLGIACVSEVAGAFACGKAFEDFAAGGGDGLVGSRSDFSQQGFELGEELLDRVEVGGVFRQEDEASSDVADRLPADITYIPIGRGFLYLVAIIDWASRAVLAWRLSNTIDVSFCLAALEEARAKFGKPEIFNTDQGSQFTSAAFTGALAKAGVAISMDSRGRWTDNVFIERLWRSLKYEEVYLKGYADGREAVRGIAAWIAFYNDRRPHQALADRTPMAVWREAIAGAGAVDMMDNASALPTCPQQQKQTQSLAA